MPITPEQRKRRRSHIGSSDMAKILGVSEWGNALDVYADKVGVETDDSPTDAQKSGNWMEHALGAFARDTLGVPLEPGVRLTCASEPIIEGNTDFITPNREIVVEAKQVNEERFEKNYGEPGGDRVPYDVLVQCHVFMLCEPKIKEAVHPIAVPRRMGIDWLVYRIPRDEALCNLLRIKGREFWYEHVVKRVPPTGAFLPDLDALKRLPRLDKTTDVTIGDVLTWGAYREMRLAFEKAEKAAAARLVASLGDGDRGLVSGIAERIGVHYALIESSDIDREAMRRDGVLEKYRKDKSYRRLNPILPKKETALRLLEAFDVADGARLIERALTTKEQSDEG